MTAPLGEALAPYSTPEAYPAAFARNVAVLGALEARPEVAALLARLAAATRVEPEVLALDLMRHLAVAHEYYPALLRDRPGVGPLAPAAVRLAALRAPGRGALQARRAGVLVDAWEPGAADGFYGRPLLDALARDAPVALLPFSPAVAGRTEDALRLLAAWPGVAAAARRARATEGVGFGRYLLRVARSVLLGRALRRAVAPRVIVSGNDNGASLVAARAAGARLVLLQNGMRGLLADSAFVGADAYVAMVADDLLDVRARAGCRLGEAVPAGSLRLDAHRRARTGAQAPACDVVYVSSLEPDPAAFDARHGHYFGMRHERAAIEALAAFARRSGADVALYPRHDGEAAQHAALGLDLGPVRRFERSPGGVYEAIRGARLVLSSCSTASLEAMAEGVPAGYLNLSGNTALNPVAAEQGLEWTGGEPLEAFVARLIAEARPARTVVQREDLVEVVRATVARHAAS